MTTRGSTTRSPRSPTTRIALFALSKALRSSRAASSCLVPASRRSAEAWASPQAMITRPATTPIPQAEGRPWFPRNQSVEQPQRKPGDGPPGMAPVVDVTREGHTQQARHPQGLAHLPAQVTPMRGPRSPADHGAQTDQPHDHDRSTAGMGQGIGVDRGADEGRDQVPQSPRHSVNEDELGRPIPALDEGPQQVEREQVEDDVDDAIVHKCAGDQPPVLTPHQVLERQVAEPVAVADAQDQEPPPGRRRILPRVEVDHRHEDDDPCQAEDRPSPESP